MNKLWLISYITNMCGRVINSEEIGVIEHQLSLIEKDSLSKVSCEAVNDLLSNIGVEGKKIEAIKAYRALTGADLRTSKDAVENYWS